MRALKEAAQANKAGRKESKRERKARLADERRAAREARRDEKTSIEQRAALRDEQFSDRAAQQRKARSQAKDLYGKVGFELMLEDGLCMMEEGMFSETYEFSDVSYKSSDDVARSKTLDIYAKIFDALSPNTGLQLNVVNVPIDKSQIGRREFFKPAIDGNQRYVDELNEVLNRKLAEGVSNLERRRFFTLSVTGRDDVDARRKLRAMSQQVTEPLSRLKSRVKMLDGKERVELIHSQLCPGDSLHFDYDMLPGSGRRAKDWCLPNAIEWMPDKTASWFKTACVDTVDGSPREVYCQVLVIHPDKFGSELDDSCLSSIVELDFPMNVSLHVQAIDKGKALDMVKQKGMWNDKSIIEFQQKAFRKGYDMTLVPAELEYTRNEINAVHDKLRYDNQRLYYFTGVIYLYANSLEELRDYATQVVSTAQHESYTITTLDYLQAEGLNTALPIGVNHLEIERTFTTAQLAIFAPFATEECNDEGGIYIGQNKVSSNLVMLDRRKLAAPSGFILGMPGSGKSFSVKRIITEYLLTTCAPGDPRLNPAHPQHDPKLRPAEVFVVDVKASEYTPLVTGLGGKELNVASNSTQYINLMDLSLNGQIIAGKDPVVDQSEYLMALLSQASANAENSMGGLTSVQNTIIDRCVRNIYKRLLGDDLDEVEAGALSAENMPILEDLYDELLRQPEAATPAVQELTTFLELFTKGSFSYFNHLSGDVFDNRFVSFNVSKAGERLRTFAMLVVVNAIRNRMFYNYERGVQTLVFIDEIQALFTNRWVTTYFEKFWSEGRQYNLTVTAMSQNIERVLSDNAARYAVLNSDMLLLHKQSDIERALLKDLLQLSDIQTSYIDDSINPGEGLLKAGGVYVPIKDSWPQGPLFDLWNTKPDDIAMKKAREILDAQNVRAAAAAKARPEREGAPSPDKPTAIEHGQADVANVPYAEMSFAQQADAAGERDQGAYGAAGDLYASYEEDLAAQRAREEEALKEEE